MSLASHGDDAMDMLGEDNSEQVEVRQIYLPGECLVNKEGSAWCVGCAFELVVINWLVNM